MHSYAIAPLDRTSDALATESIAIISIIFSTDTAIRVKPHCNRHAVFLNILSKKINQNCIGILNRMIRSLFIIMLVFQKTFMAF